MATAAKKKSKKATGVKGKLLAGSCCPSDSSSRLYLDLQDQDVKQIAGLNVGDDVEIMVRGTVKGLSQRERQDYDDPSKTVKTGSIDLEDYTVEVVEDEKNEFTAMANEEVDE